MASQMVLMSNLAKAANKSEHTDIPLEVDNSVETKWKWRRTSKYTAYVNMVVGIGGLTCIVACAILWAYITAQKKRGNPAPEWESHVDFLFVKPKNGNAIFGSKVSQLLLVVNVVALFLLEFLAGNVLLKATTMPSDHDVDKCLKKCFMCKQLNGCLTMQSCSILVHVGHGNLLMWLWLFYRISCLIVVFLHYQELRIKSNETNLMNLKGGNSAESIVSLSAAGIN